MTVRVCVGTTICLATTALVIQRFFSTIYKTFVVIFNTIWRIVAFFGCAFDITGTCQREFSARYIVPSLRTVFRLIPFIAAPLLFVVFLQMYNEAKDAEHSWFENVEGGLELMSERARLKLKSAAKRGHAKRRRAEKKVRAMTNQLRSTPNKDVVGNEEENDDEEEEMEDDGTLDLGNMRLSLSGKVRPHALARSKRVWPRPVPTTQRVLPLVLVINSSYILLTITTVLTRIWVVTKIPMKVGAGTRTAPTTSWGKMEKVLHGEAARRLSLGSGARGSQSAPASRNTSEKKKEASPSPSLSEVTFSRRLAGKSTNGYGSPAFTPEVVIKKTRIGVVATRVAMALLSERTSTIYLQRIVQWNSMTKILLHSIHIDKNGDSIISKNKHTII